MPEQDRVVEVLRKFPYYLKDNLSSCEKEIIKSFKRFETSVVQPHIWYFLKEHINDLCVVREYPYEENSRKLDFALLTPPANIEYAIEVKALPLEGKSQGLRDFVNDIGKDSLKLLKVNYNKYGLLYLAVSYKGSFSLKGQKLDGNKIFKVGIISAIIEEVLNECKYIKRLGVSNELWDLNTSESLANLIEQIIQELKKEEKSIYFSKPTNDFLKKNPKCKEKVANNLLLLIKNKYLERLEHSITCIPLEDILIDDTLKIRNFLFMIRPIQSS